MFSRIMAFYNGRIKFGKRLYISKHTLITIKTINANIEFGEELSKILIMKILIQADPN